MPRNAQSQQYDDLKEYVELLQKTLKDADIEVPETPAMARQRREALAKWSKEHPDHPYCW